MRNVRNKSPTATPCCSASGRSRSSSHTSCTSSRTYGCAVRTKSSGESCCRRAHPARRMDGPPWSASIASCTMMCMSVSGSRFPNSCTSRTSGNNASLDGGCCAGSRSAVTTMCRIDSMPCVSSNARLGDSASTRFIARKQHVRLVEVLEGLPAPTSSGRVNTNKASAGNGFAVKTYRAIFPTVLSSSSCTASSPSSNAATILRSASATCGSSVPPCMMAA
mmetsp:Transcript_34778/g.78871  ORF Transcript_34778/g.78871 Transcript_34778/m.78871 type:complete len:221 (+) Transcript_34778:913-1575(+)